MQGMMDGDSAVGHKLVHWPGDAIADALGLRLAGGLHYLHLQHKESRLGSIYSGHTTEQQAVDDILEAVVRDHEEELLPWLDSPPQTNEVWRSASFAAALVWSSGTYGCPRFELNEIGSSGGLNLNMKHYTYQLGSLRLGDTASPVKIQPEWTGKQLQESPVEIVRTRGCDLNPVDLRVDANADRMRAYIWPEMRDRQQRLESCVALLRQNPPDLIQADAVEWVDRMLADEQPMDVVRVLMHSIVWQYIPEAGKAAITASVEGAGLKATPDKPLAWVSLETNRATLKHELRVRYWDGNEQQGEPVKLAETHAHVHWVRFGLDA